jgi:hypothetical protein
MLAEGKDIIGVDFSGAAGAGKLIWVACGFKENGRLKINSCQSAADLPGGGIKRDRALDALCSFIELRNNALIGLDFSFSLPQQLIKEKAWEEFILSFPDKYCSPEHFRRFCFEATEGKELKRKTEMDKKAPFSSYNLRMYRQTYYGICKLLNPLVKKDRATVLPIQIPKPGKPWLMEICPASFLKGEGMRISYKGRSQDKHDARLKILQFLENEKKLQFEKLHLRKLILEEHGGDALDSVIAACSVSQVSGKLPLLEEADLEGFIF